MATYSIKPESQEVRKRAAEIRRSWSPLEKLRRTGLPPDVPTRLQQFILGGLQPQWSPAVCGRLSVAEVTARQLNGVIRATAPGSAVVCLQVDYNAASGFVSAVLHP